MTMSDPLGDMLTRIRNGQQARKNVISSPASRMRSNVLEVLKREGYIRGFTSNLSEETENRSHLNIELKYYEGEPVIREIKRISKPGTKRGDNYCARSSGQRNTEKVKVRRKAWGCKGKKSDRK